MKTLARAWFWYEADQQYNGGTIGAAASETTAIGEARLPITADGIILGSTQYCAEGGADAQSQDHVLVNGHSEFTSA